MPSAIAAVNVFVIESALIVCGLVVALAWSFRRCLRTLHLLQLDSYSNARLLKWLRVVPSTRLFDYQTGLLLVGLLALHAGLWAARVPFSAGVALAVWSVAGALLAIKRKYPPQKKPLVYTGRAMRIAATAGLLCLAAAAGVAALSLYEASRGGARGGHWGAAIALLGSLAMIQLAPLLVLAANVLLWPVQHSINSVYFVSAKRRLREFRPLTIGITGSYGKTSTKFFLDVLLKERYEALKTPESFNTLMGVCRVINENLRPEHKVFIVEMGAYRRGDIRALCDFVHPTIGILTAIGPQHLERFRTIENIQATKYELIQALPGSGVAIFNNDDARCRELADKTTGLKVLRYGTDLSKPGLRIWAEQITTSRAGLSFSLATDDGRRAPTQSALLGRHNVLNILGAACAALELGVSLDQIASAIPTIQPAPHRLQLIDGAGGVTVIDDSYNSNPAGVSGALEALGQFTSGRRLLVTPGMVELGGSEDKYNEEFGAGAAKVCDYIVLVGEKQTRPFLKGVERERFPRERVRVVADLGQARAELQKLLKAGDVVLFENDLPDLYA